MEEPRLEKFHSYIFRTRLRILYSGKQRYNGVRKHNVVFLENLSNIVFYRILWKDASGL